jgi:hypothetical protein
MHLLTFDLKETGEKAISEELDKFDPGKCPSMRQ